MTIIATERVIHTGYTFFIYNDAKYTQHSIKSPSSFHSYYNIPHIASRSCIRTSVKNQSLLPRAGAHLCRERQKTIFHSFLSEFHPLSSAHNARLTSEFSIVSIKKKKKKQSRLYTPSCKAYNSEKKEEKNAIVTFDLLDVYVPVSKRSRRRKKDTRRMWAGEKESQEESACTGEREGSSRIYTGIIAPREFKVINPGI